jgi:aldehyde oxidoreductase
MNGAGVPYIKDLPDEINVIHYERPDEEGPFGSSGASEAFQSSGHVAVLNAIYNACGVRIYEMPATPEKVKGGAGDTSRRREDRTAEEILPGFRPLRGA